MERLLPNDHMHVPKLIHETRQRRKERMILI